MVKKVLQYLINLYEKEIFELKKRFNIKNNFTVIKLRLYQDRQGNPELVKKIKAMISKPQPQTLFKQKLQLMIQR